VKGLDVGNRQKAVAVQSDRGGVLVWVQREKSHHHKLTCMIPYMDDNEWHVTALHIAMHQTTG